MPLLADAAPPLCGGSAEVIPNVLHKIWIGETCPPMQDLLSLLAAPVFLQPSAIKYHVGKDVPALSTCTGFGMLFANRSFQQLAIDETALPKQLKLAAHKADAHRAMVLHQYGGWFLDGDAFVVNASPSRARRAASDRDARPAGAPPLSSVRNTRRLRVSIDPSRTAARERRAG